MIPQALAKQAVTTIVGNTQEEYVERSKREIIEIQKQHTNQTKKYWWSRRTPGDSMLTPLERKVLKRVKAQAKFLDSGLSCCCCQIGFDGLVGFIPFFGDFLGFLLALQLVYMCTEAEIPDEVISKMMLNIVFDFLIGLVPVLGDMLDIMFKCNTKNALLLEHYLYKRRDIYLRENIEYNELSSIPPAMKYDNRGY